MNSSVKNLASLSTEKLGTIVGGGHCYNAKCVANNGKAAANAWSQFWKGFSSGWNH